MDIFQAVLEFHQKFNIPIASKPEMLHKERFDFRCQLHYEEQKELEAAFEDSDLVKIADGLGDLLFVIAGTCIEFGLPMGEILNAISEANLRKQPSELKPLKGMDWVGPEEAIRNALGSMLS
jgi:predicted HAD superfamily Cof-like phosphohydrolase